jgi:hypothetical protein
VTAFLFEEISEVKIHMIGIIGIKKTENRFILLSLQNGVVQVRQSFQLFVFTKFFIVSRVAFKVCLVKIREQASYESSISRVEDYFILCLVTDGFLALIVLPRLLSHLRSGNEIVKIVK